jgi:serine protease AprX
VVVAAAGNYGRSGYGTVIAPGNDPKVINIGAVNTRDTPVITDDVVTSYSRDRRRLRDARRTRQN